MQCIILAAGRGSRLSPLTDETPKPLIKVNGTPLIVNALDILGRHTVSRFVVVVGYREDAVRQALGDNWKGIPIVYVENPDWDRTNNIHSLWLTRELWDRNTMILECDVFFERALMDDFLSRPFGNAALVDAFEPHMDGTVVEIGRDGCIKSMIPGKDQHDGFDFSDKYKTVNIYSFTRDYLAERFLPTLELYARMRGQSEYYELVLGVLLFMGDAGLRAHICAPHRWFEIDDFTDLQRAEAYVCDEKTLLEKVRSSYGGYWRYAFTDFAYLYNPYFPPAAMLNELRLNLGSLLGNYPSGQAEINRALANWVKLDASTLAIGNGGSELISALMRQAGIAAVPAPGFAEYERGLSPHQVLRLEVDPQTLQLSPAELVRRVRAGKADTLVIVNPNNPTGMAYTRDELRAILAGTRHLKRVIVDESFADFMDQDRQASLLGELDAHSNLVVLRSLSKDLGVPGLRLGYVASADRKLIGKLRENCPIWHVNSLAQHFLDILPKYRAEYAASLRKAAAVREAMFTDLSALPGIRVFPSQANYFLVELPEGLSGRDAQEELFVRRRLYVKDLGSKPGLPSQRCIRVAVRTAEENAQLVEGLAGVLAGRSAGLERVAA